MLTEDEVKNKILKYLYEFNKKRAIWTTAGKVVSELKSPEIDKVRIVNNINFLKEAKFINKKNEKAKGLDGKSISFEKIMISNKGIQLFEDSVYSQKSLSSITIQAGEGSNNVFVLGNQLGTINQSIGSSIAELDNLINFVKSQRLTTEEERNLIGDIETIKSQLIKPSPSKQIIKFAWSVLSSAATLSGAHDLMIKIGLLIKSFL